MALQEPHMAAPPAALGPGAQSLGQGQTGRRSPPCSCGPTRPGPEGARAAPSGAGSAPVRQLRTPPAGCPAVPPGSQPPAPALQPRPTRPPPELRPLRPPWRPPSGTSPAARRPESGRGGACAKRKAPIARPGKGRDSEQDGARLVAKRLRVGAVRLRKLVHWSEARWGGATHVGLNSGKLRPANCAGRQRPWTRLS
ncbi:basic proline-rich protein-like [Macaca thibetana thibetana]|uniref:basic proline-rich protein-like n=1 Tax=Macaca thibetana thibetana TaxID=257877 RepID=UPI0021BC5A4B|nr:basic proline-rich protein-like [Macaca thibetana thibetana]